MRFSLRNWTNWNPIAIVVAIAATLFATIYLVFHVIDPFPPRHLAIAGGIAGTSFDNYARQYANILARQGVTLDVRTTANTLANLDMLRTKDSDIQAALTTFGFTQPKDAQTLYSLGGLFDSPIFIFYRSATPISLVSQFQGKRISIGLAGSALRSLMLDVLRASGVADDSYQLAEMDYDDALDALTAGNIDVLTFPSQLDGTVLQRALAAPGVRLMHVSQAEAIAKAVPGLKRVILWRGLISLPRDLPGADVDMLAFRSRLLVRKDLHPALQYLLLEAMREVHSLPGPFNRLGEFPAPQAGDLPLSPTAQAFYRSGLNFWQRYTSFWLASLLNRIVFFVIPIVAVLIPLTGLSRIFYRWLRLRPINRLHRELGRIEHDLIGDEGANRRIDIPKAREKLAEVESAIPTLKVSRAFEVDLYRLRIHLRMVDEELTRANTPDFHRPITPGE